MPTHNDETLHDRYTREHLTHLARLATMTPDQIAAMELDLHNALAEVDRLRAKMPSQGGEAVATDAFVPGSLADLLFQLGEKGIGVSGGTHGDHWRVTPLYTHPADQVAEGVVVSRELLKDWVTGLQCGAISQRRVFEELRALMEVKGE